MAKNKTKHVIGLQGSLILHSMIAYTLKFFHSVKGYRINKWSLVRKIAVLLPYTILNADPTFPLHPMSFGILSLMHTQLVRMSNICYLIVTLHAGTTAI